jgi:hypothetical protein
MVRHTGRGTSHVTLPEYAETLTILTGKDIPSPIEPGPTGRRPWSRRTARRRVVEPQQDKISTNMAD